MENDGKKLSFHHVPIMVKEVMDLLLPARGGVFVDGTLGGGGHSEAILQLLPESGRLFGIDRDETALQAATARLAPFGEKFTALHGNFFHMKSLLLQKGVTAANGILLDLGVSSYQLDEPSRGFSYKAEAPLDMRMDQSAALTAYDVVNGYPEKELVRIFREYGEERFSPMIARRIVEKRDAKPIETTTELAETIAGAIPAKFRYKEQQHPARRCFQAIRIEVNGELQGLREAVDGCIDLLTPGGRLVILTFHSLEDRIVKNAFKTAENPCICPPKSPQCVCGRRPYGRILTKHPLTACEAEQRENSRSACCKLRALEKLAPGIGTDGKTYREGRA
jgi:16S rRNA (cytosine1402-N4)-methyltransferase